MEIKGNPEVSSPESKSFNDYGAEGFDPDKLIETENPASNFEQNDEEIDPDKLIEPVDQFDGLDIEQIDVDEPNSSEMKRLSDVDESELYSSRETRISQAQLSDGIWSGEPGNSELTPNDPDVIDTMSRFGESKVKYDNGVVDFSPFSRETVSINITPDIETNRSNAYKAVADKWNEQAKDGRTDWTRRDVADWKQSENLEFHECSDMKTCQFVPADIHQACKHTGGRYEAKCKEMLEDGGGFDV